MITALQQSFLEARTMLPRPASFPNDVIVISTGEIRGQWSSYHVFFPDETLHFVFFKDLEARRWICADVALQRWLDHHNMIALQSLTSFSD